MFQAENLPALAVILLAVAVLLKIIYEDPDKEYKYENEEGVVCYFKRNGSFRVDVITLGNSEKLKKQIEAAEKLFEEEKNTSK